MKGPVRSDAELAKLYRALDDLKLGFQKIVERELPGGASESDAVVGSAAATDPDAATKTKLVACHKCKKFSDELTDFKRCSRCKRAYYCSAEHQADHWKLHKLVCAPDKDGPSSIFVPKE
jgi:hypothetical protein